VDVGAADLGHGKNQKYVPADGCTVLVFFKNQQQ